MHLHAQLKKRCLPNFAAALYAAKLFQFFSAAAGGKNLKVLEISAAGVYSCSVVNDEWVCDKEHETGSRGSVDSDRCRAVVISYSFLFLPTYEDIRVY